MLKKLKNLCFLTLLLGVGTVWFIYKSRLTLITPYPYKVTKTNWEGHDSAKNTDILILGDRMGLALKEYIPELIKILSTD